jgi:hypothetical protein
MRNPIAEYFNDPDFGRTRRTAGLGAIMAVAVVSVAVLAYARQKKSTGLAQPLPSNALRACICPKDGTPHAWQPNLECERMRCSRCGGALESGLYVPGGADQTGAVYPPANTAVAPMATLQDRAPNQGLQAPQPVAQARTFQPQAAQPDVAVPPLVPLAPRPSLQRLLPLTGIMDPPDLPLAEDRAPWWGQIARGMLATYPTSQPYPTAQAAAAARPAAGIDNAWNPGLAFTPQRPGASALCVCPSCGTRIPNDGHLYCPAVPCPRCSRAMMPGVAVGTGQPSAPAASPPTAASTAVPSPTAAIPAGQASSQGGQGTLVAAATPPSYTTSVAPIVQRNCLRCHGGPLRNLASYDNLKTYATGGLLMMMIQPGGPMSHFLTPGEAQTIIDWVQAGEPR